MRPSLRSTVFILLVATSAIPWTPSARAHAPTPATPGSPAGCVCELARATDGWCSACKAGYVAGVRVDSEALYEIIDSHGHTFDRTGITCRDCLQALAVNGYCPTSEIGYVNGLAYVSPLAYRLALGMRIDPSGIRCATCRAHVEEPGWCASCSRGMVGAVAYEDRRLFDQVLEERNRLRAATLRLPVCEYCAVVAFADGRCPRCNIRYRNGKPIAPERSG